MALPLGLVFWVLAVACLAMGLGNYISACVYYLTRSILTHYLSIRASLLVTAVVFFMIFAFHFYEIEWLHFSPFLFFLSFWDRPMVGLIDKRLTCEKNRNGEQVQPESSSRADRLEDAVGKCLQEPNLLRIYTCSHLWMT